MTISNDIHTYHTSGVDGCGECVKNPLSIPPHHTSIGVWGVVWCGVKHFGKVCVGVEQ